MWCKNCKTEAYGERCELCGNITDDAPIKVFWCNECKTPIIREETDINKHVCTLCGGNTVYLTTDLRPVFPEERLLIEILTAQPFEYQNKSVWASNNRFYIDGIKKTIPTNMYANNTPEDMKKALELYSPQNSYEHFNKSIDVFVKANKARLNYIEDEAFTFIQNAAKNYPQEAIVISFSGGKDSTVTADLVKRALSDSSLIYMFCDSTVEIPMTHEYVQRFRKDNPRAIFKVAKNEEQDFYKVCDEIGPPTRKQSWCCYTFKAGPIARVYNKLLPDRDILSFIGIRKHESPMRSKYSRIENKAEALKIQKQKTAQPIFPWKEIDVWLYILGKKIDFNDAYRVGFNRVGCWCCPNGSKGRLHYINQIYMLEQSQKWRNFLIAFAKKIGKVDAENYVDEGKWRFKCGGNGIKAAEDIKIKYTNCTAEENAKIYKLNKPINKNFIELFIPFGTIAPELGRKLINETIVLDNRTNMPILSIQPFSHAEHEYAVKVKTINVANPNKLHKMVSYQIRKFNACRQCLKCETLCNSNAIHIKNGVYHLNKDKCTQCRMCVTSKYISGGCLMSRFLHTKDN